MSENIFSERFLAFCSGDLTVSVEDILRGLESTGMSMTAAGQDNRMVICINHEKASEIAERVSEVIDYFDDQAEAQEVASNE